MSINKISLGTVQFGMRYGIHPLSQQVEFNEIKNILSYAHAKKIDLLDTAPSYGNSEQVLGKVTEDRFKIVTKTRHFESLEISISDSNKVKEDFIQSLDKLNQKKVYGILIHNANDLLKPGSKKLFNKLEELKLEKKVLKIGVSIYDHRQLQSIIENYDIDIVQLPFNIIDKRLIDTGILLRLKSKNIEVHARSIFLQGLLLMSKEQRSEKFKSWNILWDIWHEWLNDNKITALEAAIRYVISVQEVSKVLVGVYSTKQLKEIVKAADGILPNIPPEITTSDVNLLNPSNWNKL